MPKFNLKALEEPVRVDNVLEEIDEHVDDNEHFEFFWVPHTGLGADQDQQQDHRGPAGGQSKAKFFKDKIVMENIAFGAVTKLGQLRPSAIPRLSQAHPVSRVASST